MDKRMESIFNILPDSIIKALKPFCDSLIEEIRIKINCPIFIYIKSKEYTLYYNNEIYIAKKEDVDYILKKATKNSLYAYMEDIKNGFITIDNGHRIGIAGRAVYEDKKLINIKDISSLNIRCANELKGVYENVYDKLFKNKDIENTLIISPPKCGKTTLLRDLTRLLSKNKNIKMLNECSFISKVITIPQVKNLEDELVRCCNIGNITELLNSRSKKDFKSDLIHVTNLDSKLREHGFNINLFWNKQPDAPYQRIVNEAAQIKINIK